MDCSLSGSSVHGIFQARILKWVAISFSRRSSQPRDWTPVSHYDAVDALPSEPPGKYRWTPVSRSLSRIWSLSISAATIPSCLVRRNYFEITLPKFPSLWGDPYFTPRRFLSYKCNPVTSGAELSAWPSFPVEIKSASSAPSCIVSTIPHRFTICPIAPGKQKHSFLNHPMHISIQCLCSQCDQCLKHLLFQFSPSFILQENLKSLPKLDWFFLSYVNLCFN